MDALHLALAGRPAQRQAPRFTRGGPPSELLLWTEKTGESRSVWLLLCFFDLSFNLCLKGQKTSILFLVFLGDFFRERRRVGQGCLQMFHKSRPSPSHKKGTFFPREKLGSTNQLSRYFGLFEGRKQASPSSLIISIFCCVVPQNPHTFHCFLYISFDTQVKRCKASKIDKLPIPGVK